MFSVQPLFNLFLNNFLPVIPQNFFRLRLTQKLLVIAILVFFLLVQFSGWTTKSFLANVLRLVIKKECDWDLTYSLDIPKNISVKHFPQVVIGNACRMRRLWHGLCMVTSIQEVIQVIQEVASPDVSKLNHAVMNKELGDQKQ